MKTTFDLLVKFGLWLNSEGWEKYVDEDEWIKLPSRQLFTTKQIVEKFIKSLPEEIETIKTPSATFKIPQNPLPLIPDDYDDFMERYQEDQDRRAAEDYERQLDLNSRS